MFPKIKTPKTSDVLIRGNPDPGVWVFHAAHIDLRSWKICDKNNTPVGLDGWAAVDLTQDWSMEGGELRPVGDSKRREVWTHHMVGTFYHVAGATYFRELSGDLSV